MFLLNNILPKPQVQLANKYFFVSGKGEGSTALNAFDAALLNSGIGNVNLVRMSSIIPPRAKKIEPLTIPYGAIVPVAYADKTGTSKDEIIAAAVGVGIPQNKDKPGLIMEYSSANTTKEEIEGIVFHMIEEGFSLRDEQIKSVEIVSKLHKVKLAFGSVFTGVVLVY